MRTRKLPPVRSKTLRRKGNYPANPYPVPEEKHDPGPKPRKVDLSDEAQLGPGREPTYTLRASNPFSAMAMRFMVNASIVFDLLQTEREHIRKTALAMDEWRKNRGNTP
jgi:hypothetical protein